MDASHTSARLAFEGDGWVAYTPPNQRYAVRIHVSFKPGPGRWVIDEIRYALPRITARELRDLPLGQIEVWVNELVQQGFVDVLQAKLSDAVQFGNPPAGVLTWVDKLPAAPAKGAKGDEFYRRIGEVYGKAAVASTRPAADLAKVWEVPVTTVHRWVREARRRGHLPPAEPGRRG
jgi:hypothetical protein